MSFSHNSLYRFDDFVLDPANRSLMRNGIAIPLSAKSCQVLTYLVLNPGRVVTKDELLKAVWPESFVEESNLPGYISGLRKALTDRADYIATVSGLGYKFNAPVEAETPAARRPRPIENNLEMQQMRETTHVVIRETSIPVPALARKPLLSRWPYWIAAAALVAGAAIAYRVYHRPEPQDLSKVMVADFLNLTGDPAFDHSLKTSLELGLAQSPYIQLMSGTEVQTTLGMMQKAPDSPLLGDVALEICRRDNYQALLRGKIAPDNQRGSDAMSVEVVNCTTGNAVAELHADASTKDNVLGTLDGLAVRVRKTIGESTQSIAQFDAPLYDYSTFSFEALQTFNTGVVLGSEGKILECIPYLQKATELDPKFAEGWANLGVAYFVLGDTKKSALYSQKAFDLSEGLSQEERFFIREGYHLMVLRDLDSALSDSRDWSRVYPRDNASWQSLGYLDSLTGDYPGGIQASEHVLQMSSIKLEALYGNLADFYMREGRFADSKRIIAEAQAQNQDAAPLHQLLLQMAFLEHDPQAELAEITWAHGQPQQWVVLESQAILNADAGKESESESLYQKTFQDAVKEGQSALVDSMMLDEAAVDVDLGEMAKATKLLVQVRDHTSANWAVLATKAGSLTAADAFLKLPNEYPQGTIANKVLTPELKAVLALRRNDPAAAIALLESGRPYELAYPEVIAVRGQAYLMAKQGAQAQAEYQKLIDHPAVEEPTMPKTFLAHLGLARAYTLQRNSAGSRREYEVFFRLWKDADPNLPVLQQARLEYSQLGNLATTP